MKRPVAALVLAAGRGERMNSDVPKVLHSAAGLPLIAHVLEAVKEAGIKRIAVVVGRRNSGLKFLLNGAQTIVQSKPLGTGHAVQQAERWFRNWPGDLLVLPADAPCVHAETIRKLIRTHRESGAAASVLTARVDQPKGYGRILRKGNEIAAIREELDASPTERRISEINSGIYLFRARTLFKRLRGIKKNRKKKEYYLTDIVESLADRGDSVKACVVTDGEEVMGVNTRRELARANEILNERELNWHSERGVTILSPFQTCIAQGVKIGRDTVIHPFSWIERGVEIGRRCEIGPFAKIRSGSKIDDGSVIGSFVEVVRSRVGAKTLVKHLSYLGDAAIGREVNVGAGTVTANFDGQRKHKTVVRDGARLGCNTVLIAPVTVGRNAKTGAGAVVCARKAVPSGTTVVGVPARVLGKGKVG